MELDYFFHDEAIDLLSTLMDGPDPDLESLAYEWIAQVLVPTTQTADYDDDYYVGLVDTMFDEAYLMVSLVFAIEAYQKEGTPL